MSEPTSHKRQIQDTIIRLGKGDESARKELFECAYHRLTQLTRKMLRSYPRVRRWEETDDL